MTPKEHRRIESSYKSKITRLSNESKHSNLLLADKLVMQRQVKALREELRQHVLNYHKKTITDKVEVSIGFSAGESNTHMLNQFAELASEINPNIIKVRFISEDYDNVFKIHFVSAKGEQPYYVTTSLESLYVYVTGYVTGYRKAESILKGLSRERIKS